jgi:hypothetical protein
MLLQFKSLTKKIITDNYEMKKGKLQNSFRKPFFESDHSS